RGRGSPLGTCNGTGPRPRSEWDRAANRSLWNKHGVPGLFPWADCLAHESSPFGIGGGGTRFFLRILGPFFYRIPKLWDISPIINHGRSGGQLVVPELGGGNALALFEGPIKGDAVVEAGLEGDLLHVHGLFPFEKGLGLLDPVAV